MHLLGAGGRGGGGGIHVELNLSRRVVIAFPFTWYDLEGN